MTEASKVAKELAETYCESALRDGGAEAIETALVKRGQDAFYAGLRTAAIFAQGKADSMSMQQFARFLRSLIEEDTDND